MAKNRPIGYSRSGILTLPVRSPEYYKNFDPARQLRNAGGARIMTFLINSNNLKILGEDKNPDRYSLFFNEKYFNWQKIR